MRDDKQPESEALFNQAVFEKFELPSDSPVKPERLGLDSEIRFHCHKGVSCFNACCLNIDLTLTPYDIVRMSRRLGITTTQFIGAFTEEFDLDQHGMPGLKLKPVDNGTGCQFVTPGGCGIYDDRPTACRYYPLGVMGMRRKDETNLEDVYFMVQEDHCEGHNEPRRLTVREYRREQQVEHYDELNRNWFDLIVKKRSAGPTVGTPSERSFQLFFMASYDIDAFRQFVQSDGFTNMFDLPEQDWEALASNDEALLRFAVRFLKQVLFGEQTVPYREGARERRLEARRDAIGRKQEALATQYRLRDPSEGEGQ